MKKKYRPIVLAILDGWGENAEKKGNAILNANLPTIEKLDKNYPKLLLSASGVAVGLPWGTEGNSEVGHQALGGGRIIYQNLPRIDLAIEDGSFFKNQALLEAIKNCKENNSNLHLMGLLSDGSVHSHINHLFALLELAKINDLKKVFIHIFTDGRDTGEKEGVGFLKKLQKRIASLGVGEIASICGRYYAMDRNENYDRVKKAFLAIVFGRGILEKDAVEGIKKQYEKGVGDEYIAPIVLQRENGGPTAVVEDGDSLIFFNFREDRARLISRAFAEKDFAKFDEEIRFPERIKFVGMTQYEKNMKMLTAFPPQKKDFCLGKTLAENGLKQLRTAETEKYAHVTYFFNLGREDAFEGEDRVLVPSKNVPSYATVPEMSAKEITDKLIEKVGENKYDFILVNYANPDMVGHTGDLSASVRAVEEIDVQLSRLIPAVLSAGGCLLITADHGNVEEMINLKNGEKDTEHSQNPVPLWFVTPENHRERKGEDILLAGMLSDVAPTILDILGVEKPKEMTGQSLLDKLK